MDICGYHLRCMNHGYSCPDCEHQHKNKNEDYLHDVLGVWPKGKEAVCVVVGGAIERVLDRHEQNKR